MLNTEPLREWIRAWGYWWEGQSPEDRRRYRAYRRRFYQSQIQWLGRIRTPGQPVPSMAPAHADVG